MEQVGKERDMQSMLDFAKPPTNGASSSIWRPAVQANSFEIKPTIIQMIQTFVQFRGLPSDDPNSNVANFLKIWDTFKYNGVSEDVIWLRLFPFSLRDKAKHWLNSLHVGSIATWDDMISSFLAKYLSPSKMAK